MTIHNDHASVQWAADFRPRYTTPNQVRATPNAWARNRGATAAGWLSELIPQIHSLALMFPNVAVVSTCGRYVASPATQGLTLAVDIREVITEHDGKYKAADAWADVMKRREQLSGDGIFDD